MMLLSDVLKAVDEFSAEQLRQLRAYIEKREQQLELRAGTLNMEELLYGLEQMRAGLTEEEYDQIRAGPPDDDAASGLETSTALEDRENAPLDIEVLQQIFTDLRSGLSEHDLDELEWAMNVEHIQPPDDD